MHRALMQTVNKFMQVLVYPWTMRRNIKPVEMILIYVAHGWALLLLLQNNVFDSSVSYRSMADIAPEWVWGIIIGIIGVIQNYGMLAHNKKIKRFGLFLAILYWAFVSIAFLIASITGPFVTTGLIAYSGFLGLAIWLFLKVGEQDGRSNN